MHTFVVPSSFPVKLQEEKEGLDYIFINTGFEWRLNGGSMCLGMNDDHLQPKKRCASTSNRNFEGRQVHYGITHLLSPTMVSDASITGKFTDIRNL